MAGTGYSNGYRRPVRARRSIGVVVLAAVVAAGSAVIGSTNASGLRTDETASAITVTDQTAGTSLLVLGATHTQHSLDSGGSADSIARANDVLRSSVTMEAQHIMGWGALSPEPTPGILDWRTLDRRVAIMTATSSRPVITLCCAPDWMRNGLSGATDWSDFTLAPTPDHFEDFAALAATIAERYPDVRDFQVWNELKGFWDRGANNWDIAGYTNLYNAVYRRVKQVRPDARIGGPYVPMQSFATTAIASNPSGLQGKWGVVDQRSLDAIDYFLAHATGADFVAVDGSTSVRTGDLITDPFTANDKLAVVTRWIRSRTTLPIWWSEYYPQPEGVRWGADKQAAIHTDALLKLASAGASAVFLWQPQAVGGSGTSRAVLWSDIADPDGGRPTPLAAAYAMLRSVLRVGVPVRRVDVRGDVSALATGDTLILVNQRDSSQAVRVNGQSIGLRAWEIRTIPVLGEMAAP